MKLRHKTINFRYVEVTDAPFIYSLRVNEEYNQHLSSVDPDAKKQERWLAEYKNRERLKLEYYYIIQRNSDSRPIGTVRIYDFIENEKSFCWGSWILNADKPRYAALECAILIYDFCFQELGFERCHMDIRKENLGVIAFHKKMGVKMVGETELDILGHYYREDYLAVRGDLIKVIERG